jgi:hypothetical protein
VAVATGDLFLAENLLETDGKEGNAAAQAQKDMDKSRRPDQRSQL